MALNAMMLFFIKDRRTETLTWRRSARRLSLQRDFPRERAQEQWREVRVPAGGQHGAVH